MPREAQTLDELKKKLVDNLVCQIMIAPR